MFQTKHMFLIPTQENKVNCQFLLSIYQFYVIHMHQKFYFIIFRALKIIIFFFNQISLRIKSCLICKMFKKGQNFFRTRDWLPLIQKIRKVIFFINYEKLLIMSPAYLESLNQQRLDYLNLHFNGFIFIMSNSIFGRSGLFCGLIHFYIKNKNCLKI